MGLIKKRNYDRYTLVFKTQAVKLAAHPNVKALDIAEGLGIHPVMLYRWRMEQKNGTLRESKRMQKAEPPPKKKRLRADPAQAKDDELIKAKKRIRELERALVSSREELDILKKARRFFARTKA
jgi:transposase